MPDFDKLEQIALLTELLSSMPPQEGSSMRIPVGIKAKRAQWAAELVNEFGVRVHPELATKEIADDPAAAGAVGVSTPPGSGHQRTIDKIDLEFLLNLLRSHPDVPSLAALADAIESAQGNPTQERALRDQISRQYPDLVATAKQIMDSTPPEVFDQ